MNREEIRQAIVDQINEGWGPDEDELVDLSFVMDASATLEYFNYLDIKAWGNVRYERSMEPDEVTHSVTGQVFHLFYLNDGDMPTFIWATEFNGLVEFVEASYTPTESEWNEDMLLDAFNRPPDGTEAPSPLFMGKNAELFPYNPPTPN